MSKGKNAAKEVKKAPATNVTKKVSSYQSDKGSLSKIDPSVKKTK